MGSPTPGNAVVHRPNPLGERTGGAAMDARVTRYPPGRPSASAASVAPEKTSKGPTASRGWNPGKATITMWRGCMPASLHGSAHDVNDTQPTYSAIDDAAAPRPEGSLRPADRDLE